MFIEHYFKETTTHHKQRDIWLAEFHHLQHDQLFGFRVVTI